MTFYEFDKYGHYVGQTEETVFSHSNFTTIEPPNYDNSTEVAIYAGNRWIIQNKLQAESLRQSMENITPPVLSYSRSDFFALFTLQEIIALDNFASSDESANTLISYLKGVDVVELTAGPIMELATLLVDSNTMSAERVDAIFSVQYKQ